MSDRDRDQDAARRGTEADLARRLRSLEEKLDDKRVDATPPREIPGAAIGRGANQALKLASEFVAGILVGAGIGWLFDKALGTSPWGLVVFLLLGFVAAVLNVLRAAGLAQAPESRIRPRDPKDGS
jgi:ATP synthase protein I